LDGVVLEVVVLVERLAVTGVGVGLDAAYFWRLSTFLEAVAALESNVVAFGLVLFGDTVFV